MKDDSVIVKLLTIIIYQFLMFCHNFNFIGYSALRKSWAWIFLLHYTHKQKIYLFYDNTLNKGSRNFSKTIKIMKIFIFNHKCHFPLFLIWKRKKNELTLQLLPQKVYFFSFDVYNKILVDYNILSVMLLLESWSWLYYRLMLNTLEIKT